VAQVHGEVAVHNERCRLAVEEEGGARAGRLAVEEEGAAIQVRRLGRPTEGAGMPSCRRERSGVRGRGWCRRVDSGTVTSSSLRKVPACRVAVGEEGGPGAGVGPKRRKKVDWRVLGRESRGADVSFFSLLQRTGNVCTVEMDQNEEDRSGTYTYTSLVMYSREKKSES